MYETILIIIFVASGIALVVFAGALAVEIAKTLTVEKREEGKEDGL